MRVMVLESEAGAASEAIAELRGAGHDVVRCHPDAGDAFPCNALAEHAGCPLESVVDVALDVRARAGLTPSPLEDGVACALRARIPVVVAGHTSTHPYGRWASETVEGSAVVGACEEVSRRPLADHRRVVVDAARDSLARRDLVRELDAVVLRRDGRLLVEIRVTPELPRDVREHVVAHCTSLLRDFDRDARAIDVVVRAPVA